MWATIWASGDFFYTNTLVRLARQIYITFEVTEKNTSIALMLLELSVNLTIILCRRSGFFINLHCDAY